MDPIRKRAQIKAKLTRFETFLDSLNDQLLSQAEVKNLNLQLMKIEPLYDLFTQIQDEIENTSDNLEIEYAESGTFEDKYFKLISVAQVYLTNAITNVSSNNSPIQFIQTDLRSVVPSNCTASISRASSPDYNVVKQQHIKLPSIELPTFNGNPETWLHFRDMFTSLIHENDELPDVHKLHYLRASLTAKAAESLKNIPTTSLNYKIVWDGLNDRHNNSRSLIYHHVKSLFNLDRITVESSSKLRNLIDAFQRNLRSVDSLVDPHDQRNIFLVHLLYSKLDPYTTKEFENSRTDDNIVQFNDLVKFLEKKASLLITLDQNKRPTHTDTREGRSKSLIMTEPVCHFCKASHLIYNCDKFKELDATERLNKVRGLGMCSNCLSKGHTSKYCKSIYRCRICKSKHNTLLHLHKESSEKKNTNPITSSSSNDVTISSFVSGISRVLLSTAVVNISNCNGKFYKARVLLDSGSQSNFITEKMFKRLGLKRNSVNMQVTGIGNTLSHIDGQCNVNMMATHSTYTLNVSCLIIPCITGNVPSSSIDVSHLTLPNKLYLADPKFNIDSEIDMLLGVTCFYKILTVGQMSLGVNQPRLQNTRLGWVIGGSLNENSQPKNVICNFAADLNVQDQLSRFWELEEIPTLPSMSHEEIECENHFIANTVRDQDGRFIVKIPLKKDPGILGTSYFKAERSLHSLEKRFQRNDFLFVRYSKFMREYVQLGHMSPSKFPVDKCFFLPHHGVIKEESVSTKLRVVFNGSSPTTSGYSVNDLQMVGPVIQRDLFSILLNFRSYRFVFSADIQKMYRQVLVCPSQRYLQCILWRENPSEPIQAFQLNTVTYGTSSASYLVIRSLHQLASDCEYNFPKISKIIRDNFYVDDLLAGSNSLEEAQELCKGLLDILNFGCFPLRKWIANDARVLEHINPDYIHPHSLNLGSDAYTKTLGLSWNFKNDCFAYFILQSTQIKITKRTILSETAQLFDPLGLLSPCTVVAKLILQQLWLHKLEWDENVPYDVCTKWINFRTEMVTLNDFIIPRHVVCANPLFIEIHGFSDASTSAYGSCIYIRSVSTDGTIHCKLLCSKSKVAPLKTITVPRLELCGAHMLSRLVSHVARFFDCKVANCYLWTDSMIVLGWIKTPPNQLKTFVSHRVAEIQSLTNKYIWKHVPTLHNPADLLSRGIMPSELRKSDLWWMGPKFLGNVDSSWPISNEIISELPEKKTVVWSFNASINNNFPFDRYSDATKLERIFALCFRFKHNCLNSNSKIVGSLTRNEINNSLICLTRVAQSHSFLLELKMLGHGKPLPPTNKIAKLSPFLDCNGLIRVGGRLYNSDFNFEKKHPLLISGNHLFSKLLVEREHRRLFHAGPQLLLASIREKFWPISGRNLCRKVVHSCIQCFKCSPKLIEPIMGNLPADRLKQNFPFAIVGTDYAGPVIIKDRKGRGSKTSKSYICLFICLATKAVHVELVSDLTSDAFILALKRFSARRGKPSKIYSDNGTTFVGANSKISELYTFFRNNQKDIVHTSSKFGIDWHFIPPHSPHFGGLWEAGVKSIKYHLKRVLSNALLTFEEMYTLLSQVESILNSRPLVPLSSDPQDLQPLTPAHFLIGKRLTALPDPDLTEIPINRLSSYQRLQQLLQHIWKRWSKEYISELQQKTKWKANHSSLKKDMLVLVKEDNVPPLKWKLGRVSKVYPGKDGIVRVVTVQTANGVILRSFSKICPLPID